MSEEKTFAPASGSQPDAGECGLPARNEAARRSQPAEPSNVIAIIDRRIAKAQQEWDEVFYYCSSECAAHYASRITELAELKNELVGKPEKAEPAGNVEVARTEGEKDHE